MKWKEIKKIIVEYNLLGIKGVITLCVALFQLPLLVFVYFVVDLFNTFYEKFQKDKAKDLSDEKIDIIHTITAESKEDLDKIAREQIEFYADIRTKQKSLTLLNKLISESLIREKDLLSLTGTSGFYQLFMYSSPLARIAKSLGVGTPNRLYPIFLEELGFARLGQNSPFFIINKNNLKESRLIDIKEFKKFLNYHFSRIRGTEWDSFLETIKTVNQSKYETLKGKGYKSLGVLKMNYLLTETNMNITNVGFVDDDRMGLGNVTNSEKINQQILEGSKINAARINKDLKIKIKKIIDKQDVTLLLDGVPKKTKLTIDQAQDSLRDKFSVDNILDFSNVNPSDLSKELKLLGLTKKVSDGVSTLMVSKAIEYKQALLELRINI